MDSALKRCDNLDKENEKDKDKEKEKEKVADVKPISWAQWRNKNK